MVHKRLKRLHQVFTWFSILSLVLQMGSGAFLYRPAFAEEETTSPETTVEETVNTEPVEEVQSEPVYGELVESAGEPTVEPEAEPTPTIEVAPTETPVEPPADPNLVVNQGSQGVGLDLGPSVTEEESAQLNPSISTDKGDYAPEETVTISGSNFPANTVLLIKVTRPDGSVVKGDGSFAPGSDEVTTDAEGKFTYLYKLDGIEGEYKVEVFQGGTVLATTSFTDSRVIQSATLNGTNSVTVMPNSTITAAVTVKTDWWWFGDDDWKSTRWSIEGGSWNCENTPNHTAAGTYTETFNITAPSLPDTYDVSFRTYKDDSCSSGESGTFTLRDGIVIPRETVPNPSLSQSCGMNMVLVLDSSDSMSGGDITTVKNAATTLVNTLMPATPTQIGVIDFDTDVISFLDPTTNKTNVLNAINSIGHTWTTEYTNWEAALKKADDMVGAGGLVVIITDGNPTESDGPLSNLEDAIVAANALKTSDTRILAIGINSSGTSGGLDLPNLIAISGPVVSPPAAVTAGTDVITGDISGLAGILADLVTALCGGTITVNKYIDQVDPNSRGGVGWMFSVTGPNDYSNNLGTDGNGQNTADDLTAGTGYSIVETGLLLGYSFGSAVCRNQTGAPEGSAITNGVGSLDVSNSDIISCDFINNTVPQTGTITVDKITNPSASSQEFTFHVVQIDNTSWDEATQHFNPLPGGFSQTINVTDLTTPPVITVPTGNYDLYEDVPGGWIQGGYICSYTIGARSGGGIMNYNFDIRTGENATCEFTNDRNPYCGDGHKDPGEQCDGTDGITTGQNFCSTSCHLVPIYDGQHSCPEGTVRSQTAGITTQISAIDPAGQTISLTPGGKYLFEASGTFRPTSPANWYSDAGYTTNNNWSSLASQYGIQGSGDDYAAHALLADIGSGVGVVDWGIYNGDHIYTKYYEPTSGNVQFVIGDRYGDWFDTPYQNQSGMGDNSGSLTLNIYECQQYGWIALGKCNDLNGDGGECDGSEPMLPDWTLFLDENSNGVLDSGERSGVTDSQGMVNFSNVLPRSYGLCEVQQSGWISTKQASNCLGVTLNPGGGIVYYFANFRLGEITACKYDDYDGDGNNEGDEEPGIAGVTMTLEKQVCGGGEFAIGEFCLPVWQPVATGDTGTDGCYTFTGLQLGNYRVSEDLNDLPGYNPITPSLVETAISLSGQQALVDFFNELQPIEFLLDKSNDKEGVTSGPGTTATYTLVVTNNSEITAYDVTLTDVLPYGFSYVANSGSVDGTPTNPSISGAVLTWNLGDISSKESVTVIYQALTDLGLETGGYTNLALAAGYNRLSGTDDRGRSESNIADSVVKLAVGLGYSAAIGGTVLGAATVVGQVLGAATGSPTAWLILAILMIVSGLMVMNWKKIKHLHWRKMFKGIILSFVLLLLFGQGVQAAVKVTISDLPDYLNRANFKVYYTVLDTSPSPSYNVTGWVKKEGGSWKQFDVTKVEPSGFFQTKGEDFDGEAKYEFKIVANGADSLIETVELDFTPPEAPREYRKERISPTAFKLHWRNSKESDFAKVLVYRSEKQDFEADDASKIGEHGGIPDQEVDFIDGILQADKEYFYALRAIDWAGNASNLVGDGGSITYEGTIEVTPTPGGIAPEVVTLPAEEAGEGQILGGEIEAPTPTEAPSGIAGVVAGITGEGGSRNLLLGLGGLIAAGIVGYLLYRRRAS